MDQQTNNILKDIKLFIISWNNKFVYDKLYRQKYNIAFNSPQHRSLSPIDMFIDIMEDKLIKKYYDDKLKQDELLKQYKETGDLFIELDDKLTEEQKEDMFSKIMKGIKDSN